MAMGCPVRSQRVESRFWQRYESFIEQLGVTHMQKHAIPVDIVDRQSLDITGSQPAGVGRAKEYTQVQSARRLD
tara:strand:+ start:319 stop:540 length:222 start_codon:yes stop_codon:yes gene_type:complete